MSKFGPGTLTFGEVGSEIDVSCQVSSLTIEPSKDQGDSKTMLCGTVKPGAITYEYAMNGNLDTDSEDPEGFFKFTQDNAGAQVPFVFTPNTADTTSAAGIVIIDPLAFGGEEYGEDMNSDVAFALVGPPVYTYPTPPEPPADPTVLRDAARLATVRHGSKKAGTATDAAQAALAKLRAATGQTKPATPSSKKAEPVDA